MKFWWNIIEEILFYVFVLFLPTQLGKHFWPDFSYVAGIRLDYLSPTLYLTDILLLLLFVVWIVRVLFVGKTMLWKSYQLPLLYLVFLLYLVANVLLSHSGAGFYFFVKFLEFSFVTFYVASVIKRSEQIQLICLLLSLAVIGESLLSIAQYLNHGSLGGVLYLFGERFFTAQTPGIANASLGGELVLRPYGTFPHPNVLAGFLVTTLSIILLFTKNQILRVTKWFFLLTLCVGTIALFLTLSRVAIALWIIVVLCLGFSLGKSQQLLRQKKEVLILVAIISLAIISLTQIPLFQRFIETTFTEESFVQRKELTLAALQMIQTSPLFGVGLGNFIPVLYTLQQPLTLSYLLQPVHNIFLLLLSEIGLIGASFVFLFIYKLYVHTWHKIRSDSSQFYSPLSIVILLLLAFSLADHYLITLQQGQLLLSLMVGLFWSSVKIVKSPFSQTKLKS